MVLLSLVQPTGRGAITPPEGSDDGIVVGAARHWLGGEAGSLKAVRRCLVEIEDANVAATA
jgi:hypothetical protein